MCHIAGCRLPCISHSWHECAHFGSLATYCGGACCERPPAFIQPARAFRRVCLYVHMHATCQASFGCWMAQDGWPRQPAGCLLCLCLASASLASYTRRVCVTVHILSPLLFFSALTACLLDAPIHPVSAHACVYACMFPCCDLLPFMFIPLRRCILRFNCHLTCAVALSATVATAPDPYAARDLHMHMQVRSGQAPPPPLHTPAFHCACVHACTCVCACVCVCVCHVPRAPALSAQP